MILLLIETHIKSVFNLSKVLNRIKSFLRKIERSDNCVILYVGFTNYKKSLFLDSLLTYECVLGMLEAKYKHI